MADNSQIRSALLLIADHTRFNTEEQGLAVAKAIEEYFPDPPPPVETPVTPTPALVAPLS